MSTLVTGGAGFIGSNFVLDWIAGSDESVINLDKLTDAGNIEYLQSLNGDKRHVLVQGDIGDSALVAKLLAQDQRRATISFAAESHVDSSIHGPGKLIQTNIVGAFHLQEAVRAYWGGLQSPVCQNFRFLYVSTDEVYGSLAKGDPAFPEIHRYEPNSPHSASKAASDHLVRAYHHTYGLPVLTTNHSNNYGPHHFPEKLNPLMIVNALAGKPWPVSGDEKQIHDWLYIKDHCSAIRRVLDVGKVGEDYNIGGWNEKPNLEIAHTVCPLLDELSPRAEGESYRDQITFVADHPNHDRRCAIDASKINRELGCKPDETFETGIRKTVQRPIRHLPRMGRNELRRSRRMKILLFGKVSQVGWELQRSLNVLGDTVRAVQPHVIGNAAAHTAVDKAKSKHDLARTLDALAPQVLPQEAKQLGAWLVHYSTDYVFDGSGGSPWKETETPAPLSVYGKTKREGEQLIQDTGCQHLIFRTSWVYAAHGSNFAKIMLGLAKERERLTVIDDPIGAPTGADLLADITAHAIRHLPPPLRHNFLPPSGIYHVAAGGHASWYSYARFVLEAAQKAGVALIATPDRVDPISTSAYPTPARRLHNSHLDTTLLRNTFCLNLPHWQSGVARMQIEILEK